MAIDNKTVGHQFGIYTVHSTITGNETWYKANNPHLITGLIRVPNGTTLTIEPGCDIYVENNSYISIGDNSNNGIICNGNPVDPIRFSSVEGLDAYNKWWGIFLAGSFSNERPFEISYTQVYGANTGINQQGDRAVTLKHILLSGCQTGIYSASYLTLYDSVYENITADSCRIGLLYSRVRTIKHCIVTGTAPNGYSGIFSPVSELPENYNDYNNVYGTFGLSAYWNTTPGPNSITSDPLYNSPPYDLTLGVGSPSLTAGDLGQEIGYYGPNLVIASLGSQVTVEQKTSGDLQEQVNVSLVGTGYLGHQYYIPLINKDRVVLSEFNVEHINADVTIGGEFNMGFGGMMTLGHQLNIFEVHQQAFLGEQINSYLPGKIRTQINVRPLGSLGHQMFVIARIQSNLASQCYVYIQDHFYVGHQAEVYVFPRLDRVKNLGNQFRLYNFTRGEWFTVTIKLKSRLGYDVRVGELSLNYKHT